MENIIIRNVEVSDWAKIVRLLKDLLLEKPPVALELGPLLSHTQEWIERFPHQDMGIFMVAEETIENSVVGFCYLVKPSFRKNEAFIGIAVAKAFRHLNIGSMMFYHAAEWLSSVNIGVLIADVWDWNKSSINFFKSLGFEQYSHFDDKFGGKLCGKVRLVKKI